MLRCPQIRTHPVPQPKPRALASASGVLKRPRAPVSGLRQRETRGIVNLSYRPDRSEANPIKLAPMESDLPTTLMESPVHVVSCTRLIKTVY
jgi:DNA-binding response OmpR family regulator